MHLGPTLWRILPNEFKELDSLNELKLKLKGGYRKIVLAVHVKDTLNMMVSFKLQIGRVGKLTLISSALIC